MAVTRLAYILAASHSGSTLLSLLLGAHPQVATVGEMKFSSQAMGDLDRYRCSCGVPIRLCRFWKAIKCGMTARGFEFDLACAGTDYRVSNSRYAQWLLSPMHQGKPLEKLRDVALTLSPTWRRQLPGIHRQNAALVLAIREIRSAKIVIDSSKVALRLKYLLRNPELDVKVIRLIRDGRAVALTYMDPARFADAQNPAHRGGGTGGDREYARLAMAQAAHVWRRSMKGAENVLQSLRPSQWIEVRYEGLCTSPDATLSRLFAFLDLDPSSPVKDFRSVENHVVGNGMRFDTTSEIRLDERWKEQLTEHDLQVFEKAAGAMNRLYGYV